MGKPLRWAVVLGVVLLIGVALALVAPLSAPVVDGSSAEFWTCACGVDVGPEPIERRGEVFPPQDGYYLYWSTYLDALLLHGCRLRRVRASEIRADFPKVMRQLDPSTLPAECQEWLRTADPGTVSADAFLAALRRARLNESEYREDDLAEERSVRHRWSRSKRYWLNIVFEFIHLSALVLFIAWPWLHRRPWWRQAVHLGLLPPLLFLPFFLGYCRLAATSAGPVGGVLYPFLIGPFGQLPCGSFDYAILEKIPLLLEPLSQPLGPVTSISGGPIGPTAVIAIGLALAVITAAAHFALAAFRRRFRT